ncbi:MAG TPA: glycerol-3-phosphate 1-O-acyltransferase PlsY, partial [Alphaproteobacteria bacterium]|nr:glycerol-3-phosphate 1-O-acyltransferase PlsY [Alphaproteobacteria bacterium]
LGSIPFGYLLVKIFRGQDIRQTGSGNIGATNVARSGAKGLGAATLVLDALKGALAVWLAAVLSHSSNNACGTPGACIPAIRLMSVAALFAVVGHVFPVWLKFRGGKGVATALGVFIVLFPWATLIALGVFVVTAVVSRYVSLGSILGAISFPIAAYFVSRQTGCHFALAVQSHSSS